MNDVLSSFQSKNVISNIDKFNSNDKQLREKMKENLYIKLLNINNMCHSKLQNIIEANKKIMVKIKA